MSSTSIFYLAQAEQNARMAAESDLPNVKERCQRAEIAWRQMAERLDRMDMNRQQAAANKAALASGAE